MTPASEIGPGDLVFCHGTGVVSWVIRMAERLRNDWDHTDEVRGSNFNHVAILDRALPDGDWTLIQAVPSGGVVEDTPAKPSRLSQYEHYAISRCPGDRERTVTFARAQVGHKYGFVTIASIVITLFTPGFINVMLPNVWICSALAAESIRFGNWLHDWPDIYLVTPAQLWCALETADSTLEST